MRRMALISLLALAGCGVAPASDTSRFQPVYGGVEVTMLDSDLVQIGVTMTGARDSADVERYAECAAAQHTLVRGYGFARHLRTDVTERGGEWAADAVYTISAALPDGLMTIDAEVTVASCAENGIPTV